MLAAGASSRMGGRDKLMERVNGVPLIVNRWDVLAECGHGSSERIVVLPCDRPERVEAMEKLQANIVFNPEAATGLSSSIKAAVAAVPSWCRAALFLPADMPEVTRSDIDALRQAHMVNPVAIIRAADPSGRPGNPVLFPRAYFEELMQLTGDEGGKPVIARHIHNVELVTLPGTHATLDLDTPKDWQEWRAAQAKHKAGPQ